MDDVMLHEANLWFNEHEPPLRKQKIEAPPSPVEDDYNSSDEDMDPVEREKYRLQVVGSCGYDVDFFNHIFNGIMPSGCNWDDVLFAKAGLHCYNLEKGKNLQFKSVLKVNTEISSILNSYTTSEGMDPVDNSLHTFQVLVRNAVKKNKARLIFYTSICRLKPLVPGMEEVDVIWDYDSIDDFYKDDMPDWPMNDALINGDKLLHEVNESELRDNEWLNLYAEIALFSEWQCDMDAYMPFEMKKVFVQTKEDVRSSLKLRSTNAIFYMRFKVREGPECRGIVRKTSDGITSHMCIEARCWIDTLKPIKLK